MEISDKYSFRFAEEILEHVGPLSILWREVLDSISSISDEDIKRKHLEIQEKENTKSLSKAINQLLDEKLKAKKWEDQSGIFAVPEYQEGKESTWTLDFSKATKLENGNASGVAVEVAFNHAEAAAWNLAKPALAAEINDMRVQTHIGEGVGIVIVASSNLKKFGAFAFEKTSTRFVLATRVHKLGTVFPKCIHLSNEFWRMLKISVKAYNRSTTGVIKPSFEGILVSEILAKLKVLNLLIFKTGLLDIFKRFVGAAIIDKNILVGGAPNAQHRCFKPLYQ